jgi:hypothetical protein
MSSSSTQTPTAPNGNPLPPTTQFRNDQYKKLLHYTSLSALVVCPTLMLLPPRKLDIYTVLLLTSTGLAGNQVAREYTGRSIADRIYGIGAVHTPPRVETPQVGVGRDVKDQLREQAERDVREKAVWKRQRDAREKEALEDGRGYGGIITDQIWEVWNWGQKKNGDNEEK